MADEDKNRPGSDPGGTRNTARPEDIAAPRLTPQGRTVEGEGEDATDPSGHGAKTGQRDKAEG